MIYKTRYKKCIDDTMRFFDIHKNKKEPIKAQSISIAISKKILWQGM